MPRIAERHLLVIALVSFASTQGTQVSTGKVYDNRRNIIFIGNSLSSVAHLYLQHEEVGFHRWLQTDASSHFQSEGNDVQDAANRLTFQPQMRLDKCPPRRELPLL